MLRPIWIEKKPADLPALETGNHLVEFSGHGIGELL
jgi:hypothetical protein